MIISFAQTLLATKECIESSSTKQYLDSVTIIRDVHGQISLFIEPHKDVPNDKEIWTDLQNQLSSKLGAYYSGNTWISGTQNASELLITLIQEERISATWNQENTQPHWYILERRIAKEVWTAAGTGNPPWPVEAVDRGEKPAVVSFFSYKGGVGRTTALAATALTLARYGHRVAMIDMDLEAPGLATLFSPESDGPQATKLGVLDYLLEKPIHDSSWSVRPHVQTITDQTLLGDAGEPLRLLPAGVVDEDYLEKLARIDFQHIVDKQLDERLCEMLNEIAQIGGSFDFIFLDARAGFHDLGGVAVANLAHAAVVIGNHSRQTWAGLTHVIWRLARPLAKQDEELPVILVQAMAAPQSRPGANLERQAFREKAEDIFYNNYYTLSEAGMVNVSHETPPHIPVVVEWSELLQGDIVLFARDETPEEAARLAWLVSSLTTGSYEELAERICHLFGKKLIRK
ncbi:KGGVGR-motif variant AAA ATPase [Heliophilum fasciatum]|uniref:Cellulose biosynthesis protein BcsQ n=1 Tax=Heliophilum fasciatum TaxID=35700 RepID=A0A4R2RE46_9FIRM|nr:AAA family ATPase [Heliophilum fasciatum]MCW2279217.1 cellulose biosynthesis protein BcsQ [Heliophilum fasciatum]TCP60804.1 cellulose biosynthesis protein BcsQ [Heliophilum fasciatum]